MNEFKGYYKCPRCWNKKEFEEIVYKESKKLNYTEIKDDVPLTEMYPDAQLIEYWEDLRNYPCESDTHILEVKEYCGHIMPKNKDDEMYGYGHYLSTHTFYGSTYRDSTHKLQQCGFNVIISNWDGETV